MSHPYLKMLVISFLILIGINPAWAIEPTGIYRGAARFVAPLTVTSKNDSTLVLQAKLQPLANPKGSMIRVRWDVATDQAFHHIVQQGMTAAAPHPPYPLRFEVRGLKPGRHYWIRLRATDGIRASGPALVVSWPS